MHDPYITVSLACLVVFRHSFVYGLISQQETKAPEYKALTHAYAETHTY